MHLLAASTPAKDFVSEREFYSGRLGFVDTDSPTVLRLPGDSQDEVELKIPEGNEAQMTLSIESTKTTSETLKKRGLTPQVAGDRVIVHDPDGNAIVFRAIAKSGKD